MTEGSSPAVRGGRGGRGGAGRGRSTGGNHNRHGRKGMRRHGRRLYDEKQRRERPPLPADGSAIVEDMTQDHAPTDQRLVNAAKDVRRHAAKATSVFHDLRASLPDAAAIGAYVREHRNGALRLSKDFNRFLQAISGRPESVYEELFSQNKPEVVAVLERLVDQTSGKAACVLPPGHEWVIRCERHGLKKTSWMKKGGTTDTGADELVQLLDGDASQLLLQPREMLAKLMATDPQGYLLRRIEMASSPKELVRAAKLLRQELESDESPQRSSHCSIALGRIISKARRVLEAVVQSYDSTTGEGSDEHPVAAAPAATVEDVESARAASSAVLETAKHLIDTLRTRSGNSTSISGGSGAGASAAPLPLAKLKNLAEWCKRRGLLEEHLDDLVCNVAEQSSDQLERQAEQMEAVMKVKGATTEAALAEALGELTESATECADTDDDSDKPSKQSSSTPVAPLRVRSADVLSALAVAASGIGISPTLRSRVVDALVATLRCMGEGAQLPRRALTLIAAENNRKRQERRATEIRDKRARDEKFSSE